MSLTEKKYGFSVGDHWVEILGEAKAVHAKWSVIVDDECVDSRAESGEFQLTASVDGQDLTVEIRQGGFGDVAISVRSGSKKIQEFSGFLL